MFLFLDRPDIKTVLFTDIALDWLCIAIEKIAEEVGGTDVARRAVNARENRFYSIRPSNLLEVKIVLRATSECLDEDAFIKWISVEAGLDSMLTPQWVKSEWAGLLIDVNTLAERCNSLD